MTEAPLSTQVRRLLFRCILTVELHVVQLRLRLPPYTMPVVRRLRICDVCVSAYQIHSDCVSVLPPYMASLYSEEQDS